MALCIQTLVKWYSTANWHWCPIIKAPAIMFLELLSPGRCMHTKSDIQRDGSAPVLCRLLNSIVSDIESKHGHRMDSRHQYKPSYAGTTKPCVLFACQLIIALNNACAVKSWSMLFCILSSHLSIIFCEKGCEISPEDATKPPVFLHGITQGRDSGNEGWKEQEHRENNRCIFFFFVLLCVLLEPAC